MNMQQIMMQAQKMQRELKKAQDELHAKEFSLSKSGIVNVTVKGSKEIVKVDVNKDAFDPEDKEMIEETIVLALNEVFAQIDEAEEEIQSRITGRSGGLGF